MEGELVARALFWPLSVDYFDDAKIIDAGEDAELLFLRAGCRAKALTTDGVLTDAQVERLHLRNWRRRADRLVEVGLWERIDGGYRISAFLKHNKSAAEVADLSEKRAAAGRLGGRPTKQSASPDESNLPSNAETQGRKEGKEEPPLPPTAWGERSSPRAEGTNPRAVAAHHAEAQRCEQRIRAARNLGGSRAVIHTTPDEALEEFTHKLATPEEVDAAMAGWREVRSALTDPEDVRLDA